MDYKEEFMDSANKLGIKVAMKKMFAKYPEIVEMSIYSVKTSNGDVLTDPKVFARKVKS